MKNLLMLGAIFLATLNNASAQSYITKNGKISFYSSTAMENIEAVNNQVVSVLDSKTGSMQFSVTITGFIFKKALMQDHFNEKYMESGTYPKASFKGKINDISKVDFSKDGTYSVTVAGDLTMHGATNAVTVPGTIKIAGGKVNATAKFNVSLTDYKIDKPTAVSNSIEIRVDCDYTLK